MDHLLLQISFFFSRIAIGAADVDTAPEHPNPAAISTNPADERSAAHTANKRYRANGKCTVTASATAELHPIEPTGDCVRTAAAATAAIIKHHSIADNYPANGTNTIASGQYGDPTASESEHTTARHSHTCETRIIIASASATADRRAIVAASTEHSNSATNRADCAESGTAELSIPVHSTGTHSNNSRWSTESGYHSAHLSAAGHCPAIAANDTIQSIHHTTTTANTAVHRAGQYGVHDAAAEYHSAAAAASATPKYHIPND